MNIPTSAAMRRDDQERESVGEQLDQYMPKNTGDAQEPQERKSQATILVELAARADLFHDSDGHGYARLCIGNHSEVWSLRSRGFKDWLAHGFYRCEGRAPNVAALNDALATIGGQARFEGPAHEVATRVAMHAGTIYLDLCDGAWRAVEIDADGWRVIQDPPVRFVRSRGMLPLPAPAPGESDQIWQHVNVCDNDKPLVRAWLDAALRPTGPYPVLLLQGEQGTGKSTQAKVLRSLIDPSRAALRASPRDERDLMIAGRNAWVIALDNLSGLSGWVSDALCRIATGGGFATRELYSDADETLIDVQRPIVLNGIDDIATRQDLIDRALIVNLDPIPESARVEEAVFWRRFHQAQPQLLGACLDRVSRALRDIDSVQLDRLPRMADFARWGYAAGGGDDFLATYNANRQDAIAAGLEGSPVAQAVRHMVADQECFSDTATVLLAELTRYADESHVRLKSWPRSPRALSNQITRLATALRAVGINVERDRSGRRRAIHIQKVGNPSSFASPSSQGNENQLVTNDAVVTQGDATVTQCDEALISSSHDKPLYIKENDANDANDAKIPASYNRKSREVL